MTEVLMMIGGCLIEMDDWRGQGGEAVAALWHRPLSQLTQTHSWRHKANDLIDAAPPPSARYQNITPSWVQNKGGFGGREWGEIFPSKTKI